MLRLSLIALAAAAACAAASPAAAAPPLPFPFAPLFQPARMAEPMATSATRYEEPRAALPQRPTGSLYAARQPAAEARPETSRRETFGPGSTPATTRAVVSYDGRHAPGTVVINTTERRLYLVLGNGRAMRYAVGVGREGFQWAGRETITSMQEWPDWTPPDEMLRRQPYLPRYMAGGPHNPLGARALYLGGTLYRIHGSNQPETIGHAVSSGCIRMLNEDVIDLYRRVRVGTTVVVLR